MYHLGKKVTKKFTKLILGDKINTRNSSDNIKNLSSSDSINPEKLKPFSLTMLLTFFTLVGLFVLLVIVTATLLFLSERKWTYGTAYYFTIITTSTVGLGDVYPTKLWSFVILFFYALPGVLVETQIMELLYNMAYFLLDKITGKLIKRACVYECIKRVHGRLYHSSKDMEESTV